MFAIRVLGMNRVPAPRWLNSLSLIYHCGKGISGSHVRQQGRGEFGALDLPQVLDLYYKNGHSIMPALALIFPNAPGTLLLMTLTSVFFLSSFQP